MHEIIIPGTMACCQHMHSLLAVCNVCSTRIKRMASLWAAVGTSDKQAKCKNVPGSSSPSPPSSSHAAGQWPAWLSGPAGRSSPPPASGTWTNPLLCHTSCARDTHTETERSAHALIVLTLGLLIYKKCMVACALTERHIDIIAHWSQTHIHRGTAWRALRHMLISWDVSLSKVALLKILWHFQN